MKLLKIMLLILISNISYSQIIRPYNSFFTDNISNNSLTTNYYKDTSNRFNTYVGDWKYVNGNQTFILTIWKVIKQPVTHDGELKYYIDDLHAHYKLIQDFGLPTQQIIYTSQKSISNTITQQWDTILFGGVTENNRLSGSINDVSVPFNASYLEGVEGNVLMTIDPNVTPNTAQWKVELKPGMRRSNQPSVFNIPTDVTLTRM